MTQSTGERTTVTEIRSSSGKLLRTNTTKTVSSGTTVKKFNSAEFFSNCFKMFSTFILVVFVAFLMNFVFNSYDGFHKERLLSFEEFNNSQVLQVPTIDTLLTVAKPDNWQNKGIDFLDSVLSQYNNFDISEMPNWIQFVFNIFTIPIRLILKLATTILRLDDFIGMVVRAIRLLIGV